MASPLCASVCAQAGHCPLGKLLPTRVALERLLTCVSPEVTLQSRHRRKPLPTRVAKMRLSPVCVAAQARLRRKSLSTVVKLEGFFTRMNADHRGGCVG